MNRLKERVSEAAFANITRWLGEPKYAEYHEELTVMIAEQRWDELEDAFYTVIEFGTAGIRGTTGLGSAKINRITIAEATQALCEYSLSIESDAAKKGIAIAYDTRLTSVEYAQLAAATCAANGFKAYLFDDFRSTPELSFAVRHLGCAAGIVISASHNPPQDNGFKAYWSDGAQLVPPHDKGVVKQAASITHIKTTDYDQAVANKKITLLGKDVDDAYIKAVVAESLGVERKVSIVYSPLHGAGQTNSLAALKAAGFTSVATVRSQMEPDGNFPTIENGKPNPEEKAANDLAVAKLLADEADIAITNDPDADRIGVMVREGDDPKYLSGNQTAVLATEFSLRKLAEQGVLSPQHYIVKTIVTTDMLRAVADTYKVKTYGELLIGFKYIGELIKSKEQTDEKFIIGSEESYGLLKGDYARDKDGASGALLMAEYAAELKKDNKTLYDRLLELYGEHGLYVERLDTIVCPGAKGFEQMQHIMKALRNNPPTAVSHHEVSAISDYKSRRKTLLSTGEEENIDCQATGNIVVLEFRDVRRRITVRPSGTEPKIKLYVQWFEPAESQDVAAIREQYDTLQATMEAMSRSLEGILLEE